MQAPAIGSGWTFLDAAPAAILITDANLDSPGPAVVYANPAFERLSGWAPADILGQSPRVMQGPETDRNIFPDMRATLRQGRTWRGETTNYRRDGMPFVMRWSISPVFAHAGRITHYMAVQEDVTKTVHHAKTLQLTTARLRNAQRIGRMGGWTYELKSNKLIADDEAVHLLGLYHMGHSVDLETFFDIVHPDDKAAVRDALKHAVSTSQSFTCEYRICIAGQALRVVHAAAEVDCDESGAVVRLTGVFQDITERYRVREELEAARNAAVASSEAKSRFLAMTGHELRTPLNAINGFAELLTNEIHGAHSVREYREYAAHILESGQHLAEVIEHILQVARLESGYLTLDESLFRVSELLATVSRWLDARARERGVALTVGPAPDVVVRADRRLLRQVVTNLGDNAVKFSPEGGCVRIDADTACDGSLLLTVRDDGPGIAQENIERIKQPFVQVDSRLERKYEGLGLGLYLVHSFLEAHGAQLSVVSEIGKGTTVTAILPSDRVLPCDKLPAVSAEVLEDPVELGSRCS